MREMPALIMESKRVVSQVPQFWGFSEIEMRLVMQTDSTLPPTWKTVLQERFLSKVKQLCNIHVGAMHFCGSGGSPPGVKNKL